MNSEYTKKLGANERVVLQEQIQKMNPQELKVFRNSHDPDQMGFDGEEGTEQ